MDRQNLCPHRRTFTNLSTYANQLARFAIRIFLTESPMWSGPFISASWFGCVRATCMVLSWPVLVGTNCKVSIDCLWGYVFHVLSTSLGCTFCTFTTAW
jgi:hypothetical protein